MDNQTQPPTAATTPATSATVALVEDLGDDVKLVKDAIAAYKANGAKGLLTVMPEAIEVVKHDIALATAAASEIKAGYRTTEFWLAVGVVAGNFIYTAVTGKPFPLEANATMAGVAGIYAVVRTLVKKG